MAAGSAVLLIDEQQRKTAARLDSPTRSARERDGRIPLPTPEPEPETFTCSQQCRVDATTVEELQACLAECPQ